jgi:hypothetical protein
MNKVHKSLLQILTVIVLIGLASGCKIKRSSLKKPLKEFGFEYLYQKMNENLVDFTTLNSKFNVDYIEKKGKTSLKGQLRIQNDSLIWLSFSPALGIEAARMLLTNDSVKFINRLNKTYFAGDYSIIDSLLNTTIEYSILQSMLLGNDLTQYDVNKFKSSIDDGAYRITIRERRKIKKYIKKGEIETKVLVQNIWLDPITFRIRKIEIKEFGNENKKLIVSYNEYFEIEGQFFPKQMNIKVSAEKDLNINIEFLKIKLNIEQNYPFRIPGKYDLLIN